MYPLDFTDEENRAANTAMANPKNLVLKPQREGGVNNVYDS